MARAGSELVRITVNTPEAAAAVGEIRRALGRAGLSCSAHRRLSLQRPSAVDRLPRVREALAKYRINPGNVGFGKKRDTQFSTMIEAAIEYGKPVRIGVNWGSLDAALVDAFDG